MEKTIILCTLLIVSTIELHARYFKSEEIRWINLLPIILIELSLMIIFLS